MLRPEDRINNKKQLKEWIKYESANYPCSFPNRILKYGESAVLLQHIKLLRKAEYYLNTNKKLRHRFAMIRLGRLQTKYAMHIPLNCCGKGLRIMHLGPVLINNKTTVGRDCRIHMNVALVAGGTNNDTPTIGNSVVIGYGACVLVNVGIADYVAIGANAVVNKDCLEENVAIAGVPAKIISHNGSLEWNKKRKG